MKSTHQHLSNGVSYINMQLIFVNLQKRSICLWGKGLINVTKILGFVLAQVVLTLAWVSGRVLISNPVMHVTLILLLLNNMQGSY